MRAFWNFFRKFDVYIANCRNFGRNYCITIRVNLHQELSFQKKIFLSAGKGVTLKILVAELLDWALVFKFGTTFQVNNFNGERCAKGGYQKSSCNDFTRYSFYNIFKFKNQSEKVFTPKIEMEVHSYSQLKFFYKSSSVRKNFNKS